MKNPGEQLKKHFEQVRLTQEEKRSMRVAVGEYMHLHPLGAAKSPWESWMFRARFAAPAVAAALLCAGTAYAADGALPGDPLYAVKVHVNEPVEVALAATPAAKANVEAQIAETRVAEAQTLAARGELTATTTQELQNSFNAYSAAAIAQANEAQPPSAETSGTATSTTTVATKLKVSLDVQASILTNLGLRVELHDTRERGAAGHATSTPERTQDLKYQPHKEQISPVSIPVSAPTTGVNTAASSTVHTSPNSSAVTPPVIKVLPVVPLLKI